VKRQRARFFKNAAKATASISLGIMSVASPASAQMSNVRGTITKLELTDGTNYGFRVRLAQGTTNVLSHCADSFAFINVGHNNYPAMTALLMASFIEKRSILLTVDKQTDTYCRIAFVHAD
jgi:hypothetical protein